MSPVKREGTARQKKAGVSTPNRFVRFFDDGKINGRMVRVTIFRLAAVSGVPH